MKPTRQLNSAIIAILVTFALAAIHPDEVNFVIDLCVAMQLSAEDGWANCNFTTESTLPSAFSIFADRIQRLYLLIVQGVDILGICSGPSIMDQFPIR